MLNVQRYRGEAHLEREIQYTRKWMWLHLVLGGVVTTLFLFHEMFSWSMGAAAWYALSLMVMYGFMIEHQICRVILALLFICGALTGVFFINRVYPLTEPPRLTLLPHSFLPIWLGLACMAYMVTAFVLLFNTRIRRAGEVGFSLW